MKRWIAITAVIAAALFAAHTSDASAQPILRVAQVQENFGALNGQIVTVRGWIAPCPDVCGLFASAREARRGTITGWAIVVRPDEAFLAVARRGVREVIVQGRIAVTCQPYEICLEHSGYLSPITVRVIG